MRNSTGDQTAVWSGYRAVLGMTVSEVNRFCLARTRSPPDLKATIAGVWGVTKRSTQLSVTQSHRGCLRSCRNNQWGPSFNPIVAKMVAWLSWRRSAGWRAPRFSRRGVGNAAGAGAGACASGTASASRSRPCFFRARDTGRAAPASASAGRGQRKWTRRDPLGFIEECHGITTVS